MIASPHKITIDNQELPFLIMGYKYINTKAPKGYPRLTIAVSLTEIEGKPKIILTKAVHTGICNQSGKCTPYSRSMIRTILGGRLKYYLLSLDQKVNFRDRLNEKSLVIDLDVVAHTLDHKSYEEIKTTTGTELLASIKDSALVYDLSMFLRGIENEAPCIGSLLKFISKIALNDPTTFFKTEESFKAIQDIDLKELSN